MSEYQTKSGIYATAAEQLKDSGLFAPVGHTAYYSCYLLLEHICCSDGFNSYDLDQRYYNNLGSHQETINGVTKYIHDSGLPKCRKDSQIIRSKIGDLKILRMSADYDNDPFTSQQAEASFSLMNNIRSLLKKYL